MTRRPATVAGFIARVIFLMVGSMVVAWLFAGPTVFTVVGFAITTAVLAPIVILTIFHQIRLRKRFSLESRR